MTPNQTRNVAGSAAQFFLGGLALALVTLACFVLRADLATTAFADLVVIMLFSLIGSFAAAVLLCFLSAASLVYLFAPPILSLATHDPQDLVVVTAFCVAGMIVAWLTGNARQEKEAALEAEARLRRSQVELRESEKEWREVFEHNPVMYFMVDADGTVLNVNTFGAAQLGYTVAELVGQPVLNVFREEDRAFMRKCVAVCLETIGQSHTWEIQKIRKDGSFLWVRENAKAMRRAGGKLIILVACEDVTERRQTEDALQQSEAYLAHAQALSHTGSFGWRVDTGEIIWTAETFRIFGCDPATRPTLQLVVERTHPDDRAAVQSTVDQAARDQKDFEHEYRLLMPDGSVKHVHALARATINASDSLEFVGAVTDVTAARLSEERLRRSEAYLEEAQHLSHTGSWSWDVHRDDFVYRSAEVYRLFGFDPEHGASAKEIQSRIPAEDLQMLGEVVRQAVRARQGKFEFDFRIVLPGGATRRIHSVAHPLLDSDGKVSEILGTHMDVTEQHAARERLEKAFLALRESEQRFRDYAETASDWLWETGPNHRITHFSEHTSAAGIPESAAAGAQRWEIAADLESEPEKWTQHRATLEAHLPFRDLVYRTENRKGSPIYVRTSGKPVFDANGDFLGYRGVSTDITASIRADQAEQALRKAQAELAHVTRVTTLGELTASIAHEINQPLAAVIANAEACMSWLDRNPADLDAARRSVEWIVEDGNRASEVIRHVRALAKKTDIEKASLDINNVASDAMALVQRELSSHEVVLKLQLAPDLPRIFGDRIQLQQVIINLAMNAVEAMESVADRPRELTIQSGRHGVDRVFLTVADNGVGIADADAERMFTPFYTTKSSGMGMGLSICRSIVEAHEGRLSASRNEGSGANFQFVLPAHGGDTV
ncbi:MAG TPA: PAS domain S-box protein [Bradyrhizobium sp.]|uniref:PAS domain S-box protein n=1 Tax=Bradyrhizobium sp. TaxID=376 RepID=UPI002C3B7AB8|nr:PAS domain S-box protein [Bradyrhizobium sp.]HLZ02909.1 PAS domain S-box protein [Bradyrhizobium sp.]